MTNTKQNNILQTIGNALNSKEGNNSYVVRGFDTDGNALLLTGYNPIMAMVAPEEAFEAIGTVYAPYFKEDLPEDEMYVVNGDKSDFHAVGNELAGNDKDSVCGTIRGVTEGGRVLLEPSSIDQLKRMIGNDFCLVKSVALSDADSYTLDEEATTKALADKAEFIAEGNTLEVL